MLGSVREATRIAHGPGFYADRRAPRAKWSTTTWDEGVPAGQGGRRRDHHRAATTPNGRTDFAAATRDGNRWCSGTYRRGGTPREREPGPRGAAREPRGVAGTTRGKPRAPRPLARVACQYASLARRGAGTVTGHPLAASRRRSTAPGPGEMCSGPGLRRLPAPTCTDRGDLPPHEYRASPPPRGRGRGRGRRRRPDTAGLRTGDARAHAWCSDGTDNPASSAAAARRTGEVSCYTDWDADGGYAEYMTVPPIKRTGSRRATPTRNWPRCVPCITATAHSSGRTHDHGDWASTAWRQRELATKVALAAAHRARGSPARAGPSRSPRNSARTPVGDADGIRPSRWMTRSCRPGRGPGACPPWPRWTGGTLSIAAST